MSVEWGERVERRDRGVPFLVYAPRRTQLVELLDDAARWSERTYLVQGDRRITFAELFTEIDRVAARLHAAGLRPGERLLILAPNSIEWVTGMWAGFRLGAIVVLGNSWWSEAEIAHATELVAPTVVLADARRLDLLPAAANGVDIASLVPGVDASTQVRLPPTPRVEEDDPAAIIFTAGTTSAPKAVVLAHRSILANLHNLLAVSHRLPQQLDPSRPPTVTLLSGPLFHIGGLQSLMLALLGGNTVVFLSGRYDPGEVLDLIERERVTVWGAVPTMAARALEHPSVPGRDLASVRSISMGGAPVQPRLLERLREVFPNARNGLSTIYGMTETGGTVAAASGALMAAHPTTSGRPLPVVEMRIDSPDADGTGEIVVRTPGQFVGFWGTQEVDLLDEESFVHTGDLGRIEEGLLYVTGRIKDLIIRGGENIAPAHVEAALLTHPSVLNAAVIGRADADLGERVCAVLQVSDPGAVSEDDLAAHLASRVAKFAVPTQWWIRTEPLPMSDTGKTDKRSLAAQWPADSPDAAARPGR